MKHREKNRKSIIKLSPVTWIGLALVLVLLLFNGYSLGKYMKEHQKEPLYLAKNFYFESDLLRAPDNTGAIPSYTLKAGANEFAFELRNYTDQLRCSEVDVSYTVAVTDEHGVPITVTENGTITGVIEKEDFHATTVKLEDLDAGTYIVTATSSPYASVLKAKITIVEAPEEFLTLTVTDTEDAPTLQLTIETKDWEGNVNITWPKGVLPDNSDPLMIDAEGINGGSHTVELKKDAAYTFVFFKKNPSEKYSADEFSSVPIIQE